ncbi:MAG: hypothetical protein PUB42_04285 [Firmicutes bacterium]|nr:hypothetical protein [Bacillota bacterium]
MKYFSEARADSKEVFFDKLKSNGFSGVVLKVSDNLAEQIGFASKYELEAWIKCENSETAEYSCAMIDGFRVDFGETSFKTVTSAMLEKIKDSLSKTDFEYITGIISPLPTITKPYINYSLAEKYRSSFGSDFFEYIKILFDEEEGLNSFRSWYFTNAFELIFDELVRPIKVWCDSYGKKFSAFAEDVGGIHPINYGIFLEMIYEHNVSVSFLYPKSCEYPIAASGFKSGGFVFAETDDLLQKAYYENIVCERISGKEAAPVNPDILLIIPSRGVMERFVFKNKRLKYNIESPAGESAAEGMYYADMLYEKGFDFGAADEFTIEKLGSVKNGKFLLFGREYGQIIVCRSCTFSDSGIELLNKAYETGVCINNSGLLDILNSELLEENI